MARRKKKAWNSTNPLYRYLHSKGSKTSKKRRSVGTMTRRRGRSRSRRSSGVRGILGGSLMNNVLKGAGAATLASMIAPNVLGSYTMPAAGFLVGGLPGAAAGFVMSGGFNLGGLGGSSSGRQVYG